MNATKTLKLTDTMVTALLSATFNPNATGHGEGGYVVHEMHGRTRKALHDRGLMTGHYYLTRKGVEALAELSGNTVDLSGYAWDGDKLIASPESLVIVDDYAERTTMIIDGVEMPYEPFAHMGYQEYLSRTADNGCVGLCEAEKGCEHCDTQYGRTTPETDAESLCTATVDNPDCVHCEGVVMDEMDARDNVAEFWQAMKEVQEEKAVTEFVPMDRTGDGITSVMTVMVIQNTPGMAGVTHYHAPECRDIQREMKRWGQRPSDAFENGFETVAELLEFECGDQASDHAEANTPEWWSEIFHNATPDGGIGGVKIMPCLDIPNGVTSDGSPIIRTGDFYRAGFKRAEVTEDKGAPNEAYASHYRAKGSEGMATTPLDIVAYANEAETDGSGRFPCVKVSGKVTHKGECSEAKGINGPCCSLEDDVTETPAKWVSYDHTLTVGDVVKSTENKGLFTVYALIPGLPVVYVDAHDGEMPFPVPASKVYAL